MSLTLERCTALLGDANIRAMLHVIREGETNQTDDAYRMAYGGALIDGPEHPWYGRTTTEVGHSTAYGAYQFLGTSWKEASDALGLGNDTSPINQDLCAVWTIDAKRHAAAAVQGGDLVLACSKLAQEWVSLPGLGLERVQRVFLAYGGTTQDHAGAAIPVQPIPTQPDAGRASPDPDLPRSPMEVPMFPLLLPALLGLIPQLAPLFGKNGEKVAQVGQIATAVTQAIQQATGQANLQAGLEAMQADHTVKAAATAAVLQAPPVAAMLEAQEAGGGGIGGARKYFADSALPPFWKTAPFWISIMLFAVVYGVIWSMLYYGPTIALWRPEDRSQILMLTVAIVSGVMGYFLGSSIGSARKDQIIGERQL